MRTFRIAALAALVLAPLSGCSDTTGLENGRITLLLTDAPGDIRTAVVTISQIYLQAEAGDEEPQSRAVLREDDVTVDLLTLADETMQLVQDAEVPGGVYRELRFVITGGYKVNLPNGVVVDGDEQTFLIDFDVSQSFGQAAGASGNWVMHPVITGVEVPVDDEPGPSGD